LKLAHGKRAKNEKFFVKNKRKMAKEGGEGGFLGVFLGAMELEGWFFLQGHLRASSWGKVKKLA